jgi:5-methylcytosine-specific restriction endonuclease McrA
MLQLPKTYLDKKWQNYLDKWQKEINTGFADFGYELYLLALYKLLNSDYFRLLSFYFHSLVQQYFNALPSYSEKVTQAKIKYESRTGTVTFKNIRVTLERMCSGNRRCCYCEDSLADEVEHICPKSLYPELVFVWENYLYSCGPCNSKKSDNYAVIVGNEIKNITRKKNDPIVPPPAGKSVFINPRIENPLDFLELDLGDDLVDGTFLFQPRYSLAENSLDVQRAKYTIEILGLNDREDIRKGRRQGGINYRSRLIEYQQNKDSLTDSQKQQFIKDFKKMSYPTVWEEMKNQRQYIPSINALIQASPEILDW